VDDTKAQLAKSFKIKDLGEAKYLGIVSTHRLQCHFYSNATWRTAKEGKSRRDPLHERG